MGLSTNTLRSYETAYITFRDKSGLSDSQIKEMEAGELSKLIDRVFDSLEMSPSSKLARISGCKGYIFEHFEKELPAKSKVRKALSKKKARQSKKIDLTENEVKDLEKFFSSEYKKAGKNHKLRTLRNLIMFKLLAYTGQRIGDILSMRVSQAKQNSLHYKQEKTGTEVNIENPAKAEIEIYCHIAGLDENSFLFASGLNKTLSYQNALKIITYAGLKTLQKDISPHVFRKYVVTHLKKLGIDDASIMAVTGHSDMRMIGYYTGSGQAPSDLRGLLLKPA